MSIMKAAAAVVKGSEKLDARSWHDWRTRIDVENLVMSSGHDCILGQLYGSFSAGLDKLYLDTTKACEMGFDEYPDEYTYDELVDAWARALSPAGDFKGRHSGDPIKVVENVRLNDKNYVIWQYASGGTPCITMLTTFLSSYDKVTPHVRGTVLRSNDGRIFIVADDEGVRAWEVPLLPGVSVGHNLLTSIERDHGKLRPVQTHMGRTLVGGMDLSI